MSIRITGGDLSGRQLVVGKNNQIRPTPDRVRLALFNSLMARQRITGATVLDICAGTGALGAEALSRSASHVDFIDHDTQILSQNIDQLNLTNRARIHRGDARDLPKFDHDFDLIFFDPPYQSGLYEDVMDQVMECHLLRPTGWLIIESDKQSDLTIPDGMNVIDTRKYGRTKIHILGMIQAAK